METVWEMYRDLLRELELMEGLHREVALGPKASQSEFARMYKGGVKLHGC